jgi:hypothetical protein
MPTLFADLSRSWAQLVHSPSADTVLERWRYHEPALGTCKTLAEVRAGELQEDVLRALLRLASSDDHARLGVLHSLSPGLARVARGYARRWGSADSEAMVAVSAVERISAFGDRPGVQPVASIVLGVRHDVSKLALREDIRDRVLGDQVPLRDDLPSVHRVTAGEELLGLVGEGLRSGAITRRGARLIVLHRICGMSTREVAAAEGRDAATVRKYRNRAEAALADVAELVA